MSAKLFDRRRFLKGLAYGCAGAAAATLGSPVLRAFADMPQHEFFIFILASGGWDVTLWSDPRWEDQGLVNAATDDTVDLNAIPEGDLWPAGQANFSAVKLAGKSPLVLGPGIGRLANHYDRLCLINGVAMNTVSHPDGKAFSATGRHLAGGHPAAASINTMIANELGSDRLLPNVSILFPSSYVGSQLNPTAAPLIVDQVGTIGKSLTRSALYDSAAERTAVTNALIDEAHDLAEIASDRTLLDAMALQYKSVISMLDPKVQSTFSSSALTTAYKSYYPFDAAYKMKFQADAWVNACFAVQAMSLPDPIVRCVSFALNGFDTHNSNYRFHLQAQQEGMNVISGLLDMLDATSHPQIPGDKLSEHTHIMVMSDFCRTPQINIAGGRDHYPNNSVLVISPRFKQNFLYGASDPDQLLPTDQKDFSDGPRPIGPPDILRTFVSAFGIDPAKYLRDGEVVPSLLR
jgi:hypothetical protein